MNILVTGAAGFIGASLVMRLLRDMTEGTIVGLDNLNSYYDVSLKEYRLKKLDALYAQRMGIPGPARNEGTCVRNEDSSSRAKTRNLHYEFVKGSIADRELVNKLFEEYKFDIVVNLAAQAGVRYSIENPDVYIESNIIGFYNILEASRHSYDLVDSSSQAGARDPNAVPHCGLDPQSQGDSGSEAGMRAQGQNEGYKGVQHLVYASSSSVYGGNKKVPFSVDDRVDNPVSLYAATKKSNELFAHCYSKLYNIPTTGLRFFTVYGPAGRPDMAYFGFTNKLLKGETIQIYNYGNCRRDFTYVDDIVEGIVRVMQKAPEKRNGDDGLPIPPYKVYNIGGGQPENLLDFVQTLQEELLRAGLLPQDYDFEAHKQLVPMQPGDVPITYADATALERDFGFTPKITLREGLRKFAEWYKGYYG
ncbi:MAG: GDP-mannose 4,6-dehydratase [Paludibacteraceae bacterium]|nr:GDP-mannose 4,6-dehydratase [Paludibacteraceae bacterium]MBP5664500.1 GDP-mannose 4,6-dehydratase [Bacteroidales bacterium]